MVAWLPLAFPTHLWHWSDLVRLSMHRSAAKPNRTLKITAWIIGVIGVLLAALFIGGKMWLGQYLRSTAFRQRIETESGLALRAKVDIDQPRIEATQFYSARFVAQGTREASFAKVTAEDIRGEYQIPSFLRLLLGERKAALDNVEVQRVEVDLSRASRLDLDLPPKSTEPRKIDVKSARVRELRMNWDGGGLSNVALHATEVEGGWKLEGQGGELRAQPFLPPFTLDSARGVFKEADRTLIVQEALARIAGGEVKASGEFDPRSLADLQIDVSNVDVMPLLPKDWRARLHGTVEGECRLKIPMEGGDSSKILLTGKASLKKGVLEALPILDKIADYTKTDQFRKLPIDQLSGDFTYDHAAHTFRATHFVLESRQLLKVTGSFTIINDQLSGEFSFGVSPGPLRWLPGAQEKVFTTQHDGYAWAPMRLAGTTSAPREDLSSRLAAAAGDVVVEAVQDTATKAAGTAVETGKKAADKVFDLLFGN